MKTVRGDLIVLTEAGHFDVAIHGANCLCVMGAGIARQIAMRWPEVARVDQLTSKRPEKLGGVSMVRIERGPAQFTVFNAYTQIRPGKDARIDAIRQAFQRIAQWCRLVPKSPPRIAYPMIGCGLGGLRWEDVGPVVDRILDGLDHTLVVLP